MASAPPAKVICHMEVTADGKSTGKCITDFTYNKVGFELYFELVEKHFNPRSSVHIIGSRTAEEGQEFADVASQPEVAAGSIPRADFLADLVPGEVSKETQFMAVVDPRGRLAWKSPLYNLDFIPLYSGSRTIEVLVENSVSDAFLAHLQKVGVPYIFAGKSEVCCRTVVEKLAKITGNETLQLHGGPVVNGGFLKEGLVDELSLLTMPVLSCNPTDAGPFAAHSSLGSDVFGISQLKLKHVEQLKEGHIWTVYDVIKK